MLISGEPMYMKTTESILLEPGQHSREYRFQHQDGQYRWFHDIATIVRGDDGSLEMVGSWLDVTERKQAEAELQLQRDFALQVMNTMGQGLTVTDAKGRFTFVNQAFGAMLGYAPQALIGKQLQELLVIEDEEVRASAANPPLIDTPVTYERALRHVDARTVYGLITAQRRWSSDPSKGTIKVITDLTERKQVEAALMESEARYRIVAETATDVILTIDEHSNIVYVNRAVEKVFGYQRAELVGQPITTLMPKQHQDLHTQGLQCYLESGKRHLAWEAVEVPGIHRDGREIALEISFGEYSSVGEHSFTAIVRDVSERKRTQEAL